MADAIVRSAGPPEQAGLRYGSGTGRWVVAAAVLGSGMASLDATVVAIALPTVGRQFHTGLADLQWVVTAYTLTLAGLLLVGGGLGDRYGRRRVFVVGASWFALASLACGLAPSARLLILARALQGVGAALLTPGSLAILQASFVPEDRPRAIGAWSGLSGVATAVGPFLGGWLITAVSWRLIFFINLPVAGAVIALSARHGPDLRPHPGPRPGLGQPPQPGFPLLWSGSSPCLRGGRGPGGPPHAAPLDLPVPSVLGCQRRHLRGLRRPWRSPLPLAHRAPAGLGLHPARGRGLPPSGHHLDAGPVVPLGCPGRPHRAPGPDGRGTPAGRGGFGPARPHRALRGLPRPGAAWCGRPRPGPRHHRGPPHLDRARRRPRRAQWCGLGGEQRRGPLGRAHRRGRPARGGRHHRDQLPPPGSVRGGVPGSRLGGGRSLRGGRDRGRPHHPQPPPSPSAPPRPAPPLPARGAPPAGRSQPSPAAIRRSRGRGAPSRLTRLPPHLRPSGTGCWPPPAERRKVEPWAVAASSPRASQGREHQVSRLDAEVEAAESTPSPGAGELTSARPAQLGDLAVRRLLPLRHRRSIGGWCFVDPYGPASVDARRGCRFPRIPT